MSVLKGTGKNNEGILLIDTLAKQVSEDGPDHLPELTQAWIETKIRATLEEGKEPLKPLTETGKHKITQYILASILIDALMIGLMTNRSQRGALGLLPKLGEEVVDKKADEYDALYENIRFTLVNFFRINLAQLEQATITENHRLMVLQSIYKLYLQNSDDQVSNSFQEGVGTAAEIMTAMLRVIPEVLKEEGHEQLQEPSIMEKIAEASYPTILRMAMVNLDTLIGPLTETLRTEMATANMRFNPKCFTFIKSPHPEDIGKIIIKPQVWASIQYIKDEGAPHLGCPAHVVYDNQWENPTSAIKKMWSWSCELGKQIYQQKHPAKAA